MEKKQHSHTGHRDRMRARFRATKGAGMQDYELLELLLFYAIPRCDTNDLAHRLIEEFGSLEAVLETDEAALARVEGIGEKAATFLTVLGELACRYVKVKLLPDADKDCFDSPEKLVSFIRPQFIGVTVERLLVLLFDNSMHLLDCFVAAEGVVSGVTVSARKITERAYRKNAAAVVLAHNHPGGIAVPSGNDLTLTRQLDEALRLLEIPLLEHFILADRTYAAIMGSYRATEQQVSAAASLPDIYQHRMRECRAIDYAPSWLEQYK
ncbi:MAG: DNA repair protein RadC [Clostridia bacterium]|nr:DNA repair protein RadC [Clostridia bacterium]